MNVLQKWFSLNNLSVNAGKYKLMLISRSSREGNYLRLVKCEHLKWIKHVDKIRKEISPHAYIQKQRISIIRKHQKAPLKCIYSLPTKLLSSSVEKRTTIQIDRAQSNATFGIAISWMPAKNYLTVLALFSVNTLSLESLLKMR